MERLLYFIKKVVNAIFDIHPITFLVIIVLVSIMFFVAKLLIKKYYLNSKNLILKSLFFSLFIGLPMVGIFFYLIISQILDNQPF